MEKREKETVIMKRKVVLYNPKAGNGTCKEDAKVLDILYENIVYFDMMQIENYADFFASLDPADDVILCGGDGTLNRFANDTAGVTVRNPLYYFATGTGNDFVRDLDLPDFADPSFRVNEYLCNLPVVTVRGKEHRFLNGVGYGIDGYCCEEGDCLRIKRDETGKNLKINYTVIAIKGLLFHYKPTNAVVTVDGVTHTYKKVWLAPTMNGRYYGGGMMPTPAQDRMNEEKTLSVMVLHGAGKLKTLLMFPSIFKGEHVRYKKHVDILTGHHIRVEFDRPAPLQIDGETVVDVRSYEVKSAKTAKKTIDWEVPECTGY